MKQTNAQAGNYQWRHHVVLGVFALAFVALIVRAVDLQLFEREFLQGEGDARHLRVVEVPASRGMMTDRNGIAVAVSTPVDSVWAVPRKLLTARDQLPQLAGLLNMNADELYDYLATRSGREFVYLQRHASPSDAQSVMNMELPGVSLQREYRRYYPMGEVAGHYLGFTNIDDFGQEGLELAFDDSLSGKPGAKRVIKDRLGRIVENVESIRAPRAGQDLALAMDQRIQYLAYRELKAAIKKHEAKSGSAVVMNPKTGEVLALVNQPAFNPNNRSNLRGNLYRNRAATDVFEPGSTMKPFTIAAALTSGDYTDHSRINTDPGFLRVYDLTVKDHRNYGVLTPLGVLKNSSNVGAAKMAASMEAKTFWSILHAVGFGENSGSNYPGESLGVLNDYEQWGPVEQATIAYGYGLSVTPLQLARAYSVLANDGVRMPVSFVRVDDQVRGDRVLTTDVARSVRHMMEAVVSADGTGRRARIDGFHVAGKTGTAHISARGGYDSDRYVSVFAGMVPADDPKLVMVVMIAEPHAGGYFGGVVAAPVFQKVMSGSLRLLNIPPDDLPKREVIQVRAPVSERASG